MQKIELPTVDMAKVHAELTPVLAPYAEAMKRAAADIDTTELRQGFERAQETFRRAGEQLRATAERHR